MGFHFTEKGRRNAGTSRCGGPPCCSLHRGRFLGQTAKLLRVTITGKPMFPIMKLVYKKGASHMALCIHWHHGVPALRASCFMLPMDLLGLWLVPISMASTAPRSGGCVTYIAVKVHLCYRHTQRCASHTQQSLRSSVSLCIGKLIRVLIAMSGGSHKSLHQSFTIALITLTTMHLKVGQF